MKGGYRGMYEFMKNPIHSTTHVARQSEVAVNVFGGIS